MSSPTSPRLQSPTDLRVPFINRSAEDARSSTSIGSRRSRIDPAIPLTQLPTAEDQQPEILESKPEVLANVGTFVQGNIFTLDMLVGTIAFSVLSLAAISLFFVVKMKNNVSVQSNKTDILLDDVKFQISAISMIISVVFSFSMTLLSCASCYLKQRTLSEIKKVTNTITDNCNAIYNRLSARSPLPTGIRRENRLGRELRPTIEEVHSRHGDFHHSAHRSVVRAYWSLGRLNEFLNNR